MLIFDAHLDLAMNAMEWNRDLRLPLPEIRRREKGLQDKPDRGKGVVCFPGNAARSDRLVRRHADRPPRQAGQSAARLAFPRAGLGAHAGTTGLVSRDGRSGRTGSHSRRVPTVKNKPLCGDRQTGNGPRQAIGYILSLEGADSLVTLRHLEVAYAAGLRAVGPAHYGPGVYAQGTDAGGGLGRRGKELLAEMDRLGMILDVTHLCDDSFREALNTFKGPVWASHSNCRALAPHHRQLDDRQIKALVQRGAVIGCALDAWMMVPHWVRGQTTPAGAGLKLEHIVKHIDHVCQLAGNASHAGIGSDLDGGFGFEQTPQDLNTIADLQLLDDLLRRRGFSRENADAVMHGNFLRFLQRALP